MIGFWRAALRLLHRIDHVIRHWPLLRLQLQPQLDSGSLYYFVTCLPIPQLDSLGDRIQEYDERIEHLALTRYPETALLKQVTGVGTLTALMFVLTIGDPARFERSRDVGCFVGLRPRRDQSGERDPRLGPRRAIRGCGGHWCIARTIFWGHSGRIATCGGGD